MYNHDKRKFARLGGCVMLLLSALVLLAGSLPGVRPELAGTRSEWFLQGGITAELETPRGELRATPPPPLATAKRKPGHPAVPGRWKSPASRSNSVSPQESSWSTSPAGPSHWKASASLS